MRKIIKSSDTEETNTFRLHYFPNIPTPSNSPKRDAGKTGGETTGLETTPGARGDDLDRERREAVEREAFQAGFARGEEAGRIAARERSEPLIAALETLLSELDGVRQRLRRQLEQEVVELAMQVARKVVRHELTSPRETILCVVQEAMDRLDDPGQIAIRLNPEDLKRIRSAGERMAAVLDNLDRIHFEEDPGMACGGCYVQTEYGDIDARIEEQLRTVEEAFRAELHTSAEKG